MRNDYKGKLPHSYNVWTFYASGKGGHEVRADGNAGRLERGYYFQAPNIPSTGPYTTRCKALDAAYGALNQLVNG